MSTQLNQALDTLMQQLASLSLTTEYDADWPSPCQVGEPEQGEIRWQPVLQDQQSDWDSIDNALQIQLHDDVKAFYSRYFSDCIEVSLERGNLFLLQAWNAQDMQRLQQNLIAHVMMKQRLKQAITLFIAATDDDDFLISVNNQSGEVWLEQVGCEPAEKLADSLPAFLTLCAGGLGKQ